MTTHSRYGRRRSGPFLRRLSVGALILFGLAGSARSDWSPGNQPNPQKILNEAHGDARAGRYADALAKHVWFHENALQYAPAMSGVRLSFALSYWVTLGEAYPPALEKLKAVRDEAERNVRADKDAGQSFRDLAAINRELKEVEKTKELFVWLDANNPRMATAVFRTARPSLVEAKEYALCGKYLDPDRTFERELRFYTEHKTRATEENTKEFRNFVEKSFTNEVATLVAILVVNGRQADAERIAGKAREAWDDRAFREAIDRAMKGEVPRPWP